MTCRVRADFLSVIINGEDGDRDTIAALGFNLADLVIIADGILEQTLMITVSLLIDNSTVLCRVLDIDNLNPIPIDSDTAIIRVQGIT